MTGKNIRKLVLAALLAALTAVATMIIRIPTPTQGYIHLGDGMVLICGILLGPGLGALAAGIGSMMADLIGGYMAWVPGTFAIKALTALLGGWLYHRMAGKGMNTITRVVLCGIPAEIIMVLGYFVYEVGMEVVMGSSFLSPCVTCNRKQYFGNGTYGWGTYGIYSGYYCRFLYTFVCSCICRNDPISSSF